MHNSQSCLIVGAGLSGLAAARALTAQGWQVRIIDKGRNPGGRMATRRKGPNVFDHGAQFFTVRSDEFRQQVDQWIAQGWVERWFGEPGHERYRSTNGMNGLAAHLSEGLDVHFGVAVQQISRCADGWSVTDAEGKSSTTDAIVVTAPAQQALALVGAFLTPEEQASLGKIAYDPCIALMVKLAGASAVPEPGFLTVDGDVLAVVSDNTKKGISTGPGDLTLHSTGAFAREYWDRPQDEAAARMIEAAREYLGSSAVDAWQYHRWRYSQAVTLYPETCFAREIDGAPLVLAGDGFGGARIEGAYLSGIAAARKLSGM